MRTTMNVDCGALSLALMLWLLSQSGEAQSVHHAKAEIDIGPTVQVSKAFASRPHYENLSAGDPEHPGRLMVCSMVYLGETGQAYSLYCYASFDHGKNWAPTLTVSERQGNVSDPMAVYGRKDDVYVVGANVREFDKPRKDNDPNTPQWDEKTVVYKSGDGGLTWGMPSSFSLVDRPCIALDKTSSEYAGRLYVVGQGDVESLPGFGSHPSLQMFRSLDDGATFLGPINAEYPQGMGLGSVGTCAVLSDGTFIVIYGMTKNGRHQDLEEDASLGPNAELHVIGSKDGGNTFSVSQKITDWTVDTKRSQDTTIQLAIDPGSPEFKDRLYAVFAAIVSNRTQIQLSYSSDQGKTWSKPVTVNDDRSPEHGFKGPDHIHPSIAVNKNGVVLVTWYDRRQASDNLGWQVRAAASLDGGETFSASIPVTDGINSYGETTPWYIRAGGANDANASLVSLSVLIDSFFYYGGDTSGLAVDANGTFYPTWIDNRTGIAQLWTAPVNVTGNVVRHGTPDLAELNDISNLLTLQFPKPVFDRATGTLSLAAQLKNTSKDLVKGPLKVRVLTLESRIGVPNITNADNGGEGTGAIWDFSSQVSEEGLAPMAVSAPKILTFRIGDLYPLGQGRDRKYGLLDLDVRIFGKVQKQP